MVDVARKADGSLKADAERANEARGKAADEVLTRPRVEKPALVDREAAVVGADSKGAIGQTPRPEVLPSGEKSSRQCVEGGCVIE